MLKLIGLDSEMSEVVAMTIGLSPGGEMEAGACSGRCECAVAPVPVAPARHSHSSLQCCCILAVLACAAAHAEEGFSDGNAVTEPPPPPAEAAVLANVPLDMPPRIERQSRAEEYDARESMPSVERVPLRSGSVDADDDLPVLASVYRYRESTSASVPPPRVHIDDATSANGIVDGRVRSVAVAFDAVVPRAGGLTIQPRVEMAYRPGMSVAPDAMESTFPGDASLAGIALRLYSAKPTRLHGIYPFVEADWWQDGRKQIININGTRIDTEMLRGLFSFNIGAHSNGVTGFKLWFKVRGGRNPGGTVGARYRW